MGSPAVESVGEDAESGFLEEISLDARQAGVAGGALESAEEAFDLPATANRSVV
jgi:hypothetical protein